MNTTFGRRGVARRYLAAAILIYAFVPTVSAVVGSVEIGVVDQGEPVAQATITLFADGKPVSEVETDERGAAVFEIESGTYTAEIVANGHKIRGLVAIDPATPSTISADIATGLIAPTGTGAGLLAERVLDVHATDGKVSVEGDLVQVTTKVKEGLVTVNLPYVAVPKAPMSGYVSLEAFGETEAKRAKNLRKLSKRSLQVGDTEVALAQGGGFSIPHIPANAAVDVELTAKTARTTKPEAPPVVMASKLECPDAMIGQAGWPVTVHGSFSGVSSTTSVAIGGQKLEVLAETPSKTVFQSGADAVGVLEMKISEGGQSTSCTIRLIALDLTVDKLSLMRGETTSLHVKISGLAGIDRSVSFTLVNKSPATISISQGDAQTVDIEPGQVGPDGTFEIQRRLTGVQRGSFGVTARILPSSFASR